MNVSIRTNRLQIWNQEEWHLFQGKKSVFIFANGPFRLHGGSNITDVELDCRKLNCSIQAHTQQWQNQIPMAIDQNWCYCFLRSQFCCTDLLLQAWHFFHFSILLLLLPRFFCVFIELAIGHNRAQKAQTHLKLVCMCVRACLLTWNKQLLVMLLFAAANTLCALSASTFESVTNHQMKTLITIYFNSMERAIKGNSFFSVLSKPT